MDVNFNLESLEKDSIKVDAIKFKKMLIIFNSIQDGWSVKKKDNLYFFTKKHENKKEIFEDSYLLKFMKSNLDINNYFS